MRINPRNDVRLGIILVAWTLAFQGANRLSAVPPGWLQGPDSRSQYQATSPQKEDVEISAELEGAASLAPSATAQSQGVFADTGADNCNNVTVVNVPVGTPGAPLSVTVLGNNATATGPDCSGDGPTWWEAFEITTCASVTIEFCGSSPAVSPINLYMYKLCPASGTNCGPRTFRTFNNLCGDGNLRLIFANLPAGTYYYPIKSDPAVSVNGLGPYQLTLSAEACTGACCHLDNGTCTEGASEGTCSGPEDVLSIGKSCCTAECLRPGDEFAAAGVELLSHLSLAQLVPSYGNGNDIWGYVSPSGREYAIVGQEGGTVFVDVTNPFNATKIDSVPQPSFLWRDMKTYQQYAYIVNDGSGGGMQTIDLSDIDNGNVTLVHTLTGGFSTAHNIALNTESAYAYLLGSNLANGGIVAVNLANPAVPTRSSAEAWNVTYVHDALMVTYHDGPFAGREIAFAFGTGEHFYIVDITNKASMFTVATVPNMPSSVNFGHQGWLTQDRKYIIFGQEDTSGQFPTTTYVIDVQDLNNPFFAATYTSGVCATDHNMMTRGNLAYHANYTTGLQVFDVTDPTNAQRVAFFDTYPEGNFFGFTGAWGVYSDLPSGIVLVNDMVRGLFVVSYDCNVNGIDDTDEIAAAPEMDANGNGLPDSCETIVAPPAPQQPGGQEKTRYLSFIVDPSGAGQQTALRVELKSLDLFGNDLGYRYVNTVRDAGNQPVFDCPDSAMLGTSFQCAALSCTPEYRDWAADFGGEALNVTDAAVVPNSLYRVAHLASTCAGQEETCTTVSADLPLTTARWGDVNGDLDLNILDVSNEVDRLKDVPTGSLPKPHSQVQPDDPDPLTGITVLDVASVVDSLKGFAYPYGGPGNCP